MDGSVQNVRSVKRSKEEKKVIKRNIKTSHTLLKHEGIITATQPTKYLVISNGGLGNGVSRELLSDLLNEAGTVESLLMPPDKPYSYVTYTSLEESRKAHVLFNGRALTCNGRDVTLYCSYVHKVDGGVSVCSSLPPGLCVLEDFVSPEQEARLLQAVDWTSHSDVTVQKELKHRRVKHYGYEFRYDNNNVDKDKPLPGGLPSVCDAVVQKCVCEGHISVLPDQLTVNQYEIGQGIPPHVDTHSPFEDTILSLSLGAKTVMDFRHPDGRSVAVVLPARSLLVMKGESRYLWTHGITPRKFDVVPALNAEGSGVVNLDPSNLTLTQRGTRTSFTFRKIRHTPCNCAYPSKCDSQRPPSPPRVPVARTDACQLEEQYVHRVYEEISSHFSGTRHTPWPRVRDFLLTLPEGAAVADVGCGNGKYLGVNPQVFSVGCDRSANLVSICAERGFQSLVCDALSVPLRGSAFDAIISIAVIHHLSTQERRLAAVTELVRLLKVGGRALIYVWAMEQEYKNQKSNYLKPSRIQENQDENQKNQLDHRNPQENQHENQENQHDNQENQDENHESPQNQQEDQRNPQENQESVELETDPKNVVSTKTEHDANVSSEQDCGNSSPPKLGIHTNRTAFASQDLLVPWHLKGEAKSSEKSVFHRFYHVFQQGELETLCESVGGVKVQQSYYDQGNWCVILQKMHQ